LTALGKGLILIGAVILIAGVLLVLGDRIPWLGRLPGDILVKREKFTFYFPLATCVLISLILSLIFWLLRK
jgi:hypothetical protein